MLSFLLVKSKCCYKIISFILLQRQFAIFMSFFGGDWIEIDSLNWINMCHMPCLPNINAAYELSRNGSKPWQWPHCYKIAFQLLQRKSEAQNHKKKLPKVNFRIWKKDHGKCLLITPNKFERIITWINRNKHKKLI